MTTNRSTVRHLLTILLIATIGVSLAGQTFAAVLSAEAQGGRIFFSTNTAYDKLALTVSGGDRFVTKLFEATELAAFNPTEYDLPDGEYSYQAVLYPAPRRNNSQGDDPTRGIVSDAHQPIKSSGTFVVSGGLLVEPDRFATEAGQTLEENPDPNAQVILTDLIVEGSACLGLDCVSSESFGFDTLRLKENNLRIHFNDTSASASFPSNDWEITINDSTNGGANYFGITDRTAGRRPFTIEAGAPVNSLYVDQGGDIGIGTAAPVVEVHAVDGNTPTLRLEQNGSNGFTPQTWDLAGNEANFFIRDVTNGSRLPLQIKPGAPTAAIFVEADGDIGLGTASPGADLDVAEGSAKFQVEVGSDQAQALVTDAATGTGLVPMLKLENTGSGAREMILAENFGQSVAIFDDKEVPERWLFGTFGANFIIDNQAAAGVEFQFTGDGNLVVGGTTVTVPDYVFGDDYELMSLSELEAFIEAESHLPGVPSAAEIGDKGINLNSFPMRLLEKIEELTLYTLEQQRTITDLKDQIDSLRSQVESGS